MRLSHRPLRSSRAALAAAALGLTAMLSACGSGISLDEPIEGPDWRLVQLGDQRIAPAPDAARQPKLRFDGDGRINGSGGCNRFTGAFTRSASQLRMTQLAASRMACPDSASGATETQFFQALQTTTSYRLPAPGRLALLDASGRTLATLESGAPR